MFGLKLIPNLSQGPIPPHASKGARKAVLLIAWEVPDFRDISYLFNWGRKLLRTELFLHG